MNIFFTKFTKPILIFLGLSLLLIIISVAKDPPADGAEIYFLNVGQGDAVLIQKNDVQILIDGGPDETVLSELGKYMPLGDRKIETIILTHPHADHLVGINAVLNRYEVDTVYGSGVISSTNQYLEFLDKIKTKKINFKVPQIGESLEPFSFGNVSFLWPGDQYLGKNIENINNSSIVAKFCYYQKCTLLTGDIEKDEQDQMIGYYVAREEVNQFKADIYKVPHHGSNTATNEDFYRIVNPTFSIISCGKDNRYGHPHQAALTLAREFQNQILRTDRDGTIKFLLTESLIARTDR